MSPQFDLIQVDQCSATSFLVDAIQAILGSKRVKMSRAGPTTGAAQATEIDLAVRQLASALDVDLDHISGNRVCNGSMADILDLLDLLHALGQKQQRVKEQPWDTAPMKVQHGRYPTMQNVFDSIQGGLVKAWAVFHICL